MAYYDFLVSKLAEGMQNELENSRETWEGTLYSVFKKLYDFYSTHTIEECTKEAEMKLWDSLTSETDATDEFLSDVEGLYEDEPTEYMYGLTPHEAIILKPPNYL